MTSYHAGKYTPRGTASACRPICAELTSLRAQHGELVRKYERVSADYAVVARERKYWCSQALKLKRSNMLLSAVLSAKGQQRSARFHQSQGGRRRRPCSRIELSRPVSCMHGRDSNDGGRHTCAILKINSAIVGLRGTWPSACGDASKSASRAWGRRHTAGCKVHSATPAFASNSTARRRS